MNAYASSVGARSASCAHGPRAASHDSRYLSNTHLSNFPLFIKKGNLLADLSLFYFLTT